MSIRFEADNTGTEQDLPNFKSLAIRICHYTKWSDPTLNSGQI